MPKEKKVSQPKLVRRVETLRKRVRKLQSDAKRLKQSERELQEALSGFRLAVEGSMTGLNIIQDGVFRYVNPAFAKMFGYERERILDSIFLPDLAHPDDGAKVQESVRRRVEGEVESVQYLFRG